jgi:hypothetical protein
MWWITSPEDEVAPPAAGFSGRLSPSVCLTASRECGTMHLLWFCARKRKEGLIMDGVTFLGIVVIAGLFIWGQKRVRCRKCRYRGPRMEFKFGRCPECKSHEYPWWY